MKKFSIALTVPFICISILLINAYIIMPIKINHDIKKSCENEKTIVGKISFECKKITKINKLIDFWSFFGYSFCADYLNDEGEIQSINGYIEINLIFPFYDSFYIKQYRCNPLNY
jgi:hypothetical protein